LPKIKRRITLTIIIASLFFLPIVQVTSLQFEYERLYYIEADRECKFICVEDNFAYVIEKSTINDYLGLYDVSQANKSIPQNSTRSCSNYDRLVVNDSVAYTQCFYSSVSVINCSVPTNLNTIFSLSSSALEPAINWFDIWDWYIFIDFFGELSIYNYTDFQYPPVELNVTYSVTSMFYVQDFYFFMKLGSGFKIIDFHNLTNPELMSSYNDAYTFTSMVVAENYTYLVDSDNMIHVIDVSNKSAPVEVGYFGWMFNDIKGIEIRDNYLFALYNEKFRIYNLTDLDSITLLGEFDGSDYGSYNDFDISGNFAYLVGNYNVNGSIICVVDISDLANPKYIIPIPSPTGNGFNFFDLPILRLLALILVVPLAIILAVAVAIVLIIKKVGKTAKKV